MEKGLLRIFDFFSRRRTLFFGAFLGSIVVLSLLASRIHLEEDISSVLPAQNKTGNDASVMNELFNNSTFIDKLVVTVSVNDTTNPQPDSLVAYADAFVEQARHSLSEYIRQITYKVDDELAMELFHLLPDHLPIYLTDADYREIDSLLQPATLRKTLEQDLKTLSSPAGLPLKEIIARDPAGISMITLRKLQQMQYDDRFTLYDGAIVTKDNRHLVLFITPIYPSNNTGKNSVMLAGIDQLAADLRSNGFKDCTISYFGSAAVAAGNARQLRADTVLTLSLTLVLVFVFIGWYFRRKRAPFVILVPVAFGALFSLALIAVIRGHISVIALGTGSVILGIAVSYSLHVYNHYRHTGDMRQTIRDLSGPLTIGSLTTIGGFLCLQFVQSAMLKDLGLFAALSLVGASFCSLVFLPQLINQTGSSHLQKRSGYAWIEKISSWRPERQRWLVAGIFLLTLFFAYTAQRVRFESDLTRMNYMSPGLQQAEHDLNSINESALRSAYLVSRGKDLQQALEANELVVKKLESLKEKNQVKKWAGPSGLLVSDSLQKLRLRRWNDYWTKEKKDTLLARLQRFGQPLGFRSTAFDALENRLNTPYEQVSADSMQRLRQTLLTDYITENNRGVMIVTLVSTAPEQRSALYEVFAASAQTTIADKQRLTEIFVSLINQDFTRIALLSSLLVFTVLWLTYGRIELALVSFIPMFIAWVWILGIMALAGIHFNIINIILSALIFGLGDDYSLFIMDGLLQDYKTGKKNLSSFKSSIVLSAVCTLAGLGVLIFARHPALRSIALISIIGMGCVVLMAQTLIPFLFAALIGNRVKKNFFPITFFGLVKSVFSFAYFAIGCLLLTVFGILLIKLNPFNKEKGKLIYHYLLSKYAWTLLYVMVNVKKKLVNSVTADFSRPAVIIANHQSFLDILLTAMLHPKLILLTNHWVWNSPVFGLVVRLADYYPVPHGIENSIDHLSARVNEGYSIVVFPEGTRASGDTIKRFHKGAFFLAEKLGLDIQPLLIHGSSYTMSKGDFLLKDGRITLEYLPRITTTDTRFGLGYAERAKQIGRYFRSAYQRLKQEQENPAYFREKLIFNYIYKGPVLEWYLRVKIRLEKNYQPIHQLLPLKGRILDVGCGYGFMSYALRFAAPDRQLTGFDYDEEKINVANRCFSRDGQIHFVAADAAEFQFDHYDGIVIADMLHYLQPGAQEALIERCIASLSPGGKLIIREGNKDLKEKQRGTALTEFFSTRLIGFNKTTKHGLSFLSGERIRQLAVRRGLNYEELDETRFTSNMIFVMQRSTTETRHERV